MRRGTRHTRRVGKQPKPVNWCRKNFVRTANDAACYKIAFSRREVGTLASEPGKPIRRYASGKFLSLGLEAVLAAVPGTGIGAFSSPSARRFATFGRSVEVVRKGQEWIWLPRRFR